VLDRKAPLNGDRLSTKKQLQAANNNNDNNDNNSNECQTKNSNELPSLLQSTSLPTTSNKNRDSKIVQENS
ncbi:hypothetical protein KR044_006958, partial [Drosophila immigrans]